MILPLWYAILFGIGYVLFNIIIIKCITLYPNYSILSRIISGLGNTEQKSAKIFNPAILIMGVLLLPFPYYLFQVLPINLISYIGIGTFYSNPIGMVLLGIFPENKEKGHYVAAALGMGGLLLANIILIYPIILSSLNNTIVVITIIMLIFCVPLVISLIKNVRSYEPDKRIENLFYNLNFWEWFQFIMLQIWIIAVYINLLFI